MRVLVRAALAVTTAAALTGFAAAPASAGEWEPMGPCNGYVDVSCTVKNPDGDYGCLVYVNNPTGADICL